MIEKKIAFVVSSLARGGAEKTVVNLASYMADVLALNVTIIIFFSVDQSYTPSEKVLIYNLDTKRPPYSIYEEPFLLFKRTTLLKKYFQKREFDKIFSFMDPVNFSVIMTGFPVITSSHHSLDFVSCFYLPFFFLYKRKNLKKVVALTNKMELDFWDKKIHNTCVIPNPVSCFNDDTFSTYTSIFKEYSNKKFFLAVGRLNPVKNFSFLIKAFRKVALSHNFILLIAGEGEEKNILLSLIKKTQLEDSVKLLGLQGDAEMSWLYKNAYATVLTSHTEAFPSVLIESLSNGTPVVATDCPDGPRDIVLHGKNGFLVPTEDLFQFESTLCSLASNNFLREQLAKNAVNSVSHLSIDKIANKWLSL